MPKHEAESPYRSILAPLLEKIPKSAAAIVTLAILLHWIVRDTLKELPETERTSVVLISVSAFILFALLCFVLEVGIFDIGRLRKERDGLVKEVSNLLDKKEALEEGIREVDDEVFNLLNIRIERDPLERDHDVMSQVKVIRHKLRELLRLRNETPPSAGKGID